MYGCKPEGVSLRVLWSIAAISAGMLLSYSPAQGARCRTVEIPSSFEAGRVMARPVAARDGKTLTFWVDSDGAGFLMDDVGAAYGTPAVAPAHSLSPQHYSLPAFAPPGIPPLTALDAKLPSLRRADVANDPIFSGLDGQLGASWLENRVWTFDYQHEHLIWRCDGSDPSHSRNEEIPLTYNVDADGKLSGGAQYPDFKVDLDGQTLDAALDTAATVALSRAGLAKIGDEAGPAVRATSFATRGLVQGWHAKHPDWPYAPGVGSDSGVDAIRVPAMPAGPVMLRGVWFTTRPHDDVFENETVVLKVGPTAFDGDVLTIDYPRKIAIVQRSL